MLFIVTNPKGEVVSTLPWHAWDVRVQASNLNFHKRLRPDHIDDIDLALAISILQANGWDVQPA